MSWNSVDMPDWGSHCRSSHEKWGGIVPNRVRRKLLAFGGTRIGPIWRNHKAQTARPPLHIRCFGKRFHAEQPGKKVKL